MPKPPPARSRKAATARSQSPRLHGVDQGPPAPRRLTEVGVAEQEGRRIALVAAVDHGLDRGGHVGALAVRLSAAHHLGAPGQRHLGAAVARGVVGDHDLGTRKRPRQSVQRGPDPGRLVVRRDDHHRVAGHGRLFCRAMPDVEAHITGTVWKVEVAVGDQVDEGDTVVILESMKMEMPVEAEDPGTVKPRSAARRASRSRRATSSSSSDEWRPHRSRRQRRRRRGARVLRRREARPRSPGRGRRAADDLESRATQRARPRDPGRARRGDAEPRPRDRDPLRGRSPATGEVFSAGYDIADIPEETFAADAEALVAHPFHAAMEAISAHPYPVLAAINGHCLGGGPGARRFDATCACAR